MKNAPYGCLSNYPGFTGIIRASVICLLSLFPVLLLGAQTVESEPGEQQQTDDAHYASQAKADQTMLANLEETQRIIEQGIQQITIQQAQNAEQIQTLYGLLASIALLLLISSAIYFFIKRRSQNRYPVPRHYDQEIEHLAETVFGERPPAANLEARIDWFQSHRNLLQEVRVSLPADEQETPLLGLVNKFGKDQCTLRNVATALIEAAAPKQGTSAAMSASVRNLQEGYKQALTAIDEQYAQQLMPTFSSLYRPFQTLEQHWPSSSSSVQDAAAQLEQTLQLLHDHAGRDEASPARTLSALFSQLRTVTHDLQAYRNPVAVMKRYRDHPLANAVPSFAQLYDKVYELDRSARVREEKICVLNAQTKAQTYDITMYHSALDSLLQLTGQPNHNGYSVVKIKEIVNQQTPSQLILQITARSALSALRRGYKHCDSRVSAVLNRILHLDAIVKYLDMLLATEPLAWTHENLKKQYVEERGLKRNHLHLLLRAEAILDIYFSRQEAASEIRNAIFDSCTAFRLFMRAEGFEFEHITLLQAPASTDQTCHETDPKLHESASIGELVKAVAKYRSNFVVDVKRFGWKKEGRLIKPSEVVLFSPSEWL